tara:strand:- start:1371 stop:1964 length:594 start_codon:yes stop_codon:yes gene_type:complete
MEIFSYFASPIYREERPDWVEKTIEHSEKHYLEIKQQMGDHAPVLQTGSMTKDPDLLFLTSYFRDKGVSILKEQGYLTDEYEFFVAGMWGQEFACTGSNVLHVHADSQISGFYFLECPEGGSYPVFDDPRAGKKMTDLMTNQSNEVHVATPLIHFNNLLPGTLMLFNSWLPHMITKNQSEEKTKFVHFTLGQRRRFI